MRLPFGLRWWELAPEALLGAGLGFFLLTEWNAATSAFRSEKAIGLMAVTAVAWLVLRFGLGRLGGAWRVPRTALFAAGALGVLAVVVLPAYDDETVIETLAVDSVGTTTAPAAPPPAEGAPATAPTTTATTRSLQPRVVASGTLHGIDHDATGTARVYERPDGSLVVGLEDIDIQPGPDYDVYVVPGAGREDVGDGIRLDDLRGNRGTQYYDVPAGTALMPGAWTVLVWCETFDVPVAGSTPT